MCDEVARDRQLVENVELALTIEWPDDVHDYLLDGLLELLARRPAFFLHERLDHLQEPFVHVQL